MPSPQFPSQIRLVLKLTAISAAIGAAYSQMHVTQDNGPLFALYGMARGAGDRRRDRGRPFLP